MNPCDNDELLIRIDERTKNILDKLDGMDKRVTKLEDRDRLEPYWKIGFGVGATILGILGIKF